ncbi:MAG: YceI family protein [Rhodobacteraceae bacterium]|jgi:polyisoprenoid-binding protein YceI|nr:YceI family protein [Paracoccaceae bacterium]
MRTAILALCRHLAALSPAAADAIADRPDPAASTVGFGDAPNGTPQRGTMPVAAADIALDVDRAAGRRVRVLQRPGQADAGTPIATEAMRSPGVPDAAAHPEIAFASTAIRAAGQGAEVDRRRTIRGVTRDMRLMADIFRPPGSRDHDLSRLTVVLRGTVRLRCRRIARSCRRHGHARHRGAAVAPLGDVSGTPIRD